MSWRVIGHVTKGRERFNISAREMGDTDEAAGMVESGEMPLPNYLWLHPEARLSPDERTQFALGLEATFGDERAAEPVVGAGAEDRDGDNL